MTHDAPQYYPLVFSTFWVEYQLWGLHPLGYHLVNVLLHAANALLVWRLFARLGVNGAWLIGAIFALHTVHVESVAWITERKNVLSALFYLLSALAYLRFDPAEASGVETPHRRRWMWYGAAMVLFVAALLSKSVTCSLPAALILAMLYRRQPLTAARLLPLVPFFLIGLSLALNTAGIEHARVGARGEAFSSGFVERSLVAARILLFYPWKLLVPWPVMFNYPRWNIDSSSPISYVAPLVVIAVGVAAVILYRRGMRGPLLALAFYAGTIFPALGFVNVYPHLFSYVADHFAYLASLGPIALVVTVYVRLVHKPSRQVLLAFIPLTCLFLLTWSQAATYLSEESVWRDTLSKNPDAWMPRSNLSSLLLRQANESLRQGDTESAAALVAEARQHAEAAVVLKPDQHTAHAKLAEALRLEGKLELALFHVQRAIEERPLGSYFFQEGRLYQQLGRSEEAIDAYQRAIELGRPRDPETTLARFELGRLLFQLDDPARAEPYLLEVLEVRPFDADCLMMVGELAEARDDDAAAERRFRLAFEKARNDETRLKAGFRLARLLATSDQDQLRDGAAALTLAEQLVHATNGQSPHMLQLLAASQAELSAYDDAAATLEQAIALAKAQGRSELTDELEEQLALYRSRRPWRR